MSRQFILDRPERLTPFTAWLAKQALPLDVQVAPYVPKRSDAQNRRLWALHGLAAEHVGCSADDMHEDMLCEHYGYTEIKMPSGDIKRKPLKRSSQRNKAEFAKFMEFVDNFYATEFGIWLQSDTLEEAQ